MNMQSEALKDSQGTNDALYMLKMQNSASVADIARIFIVLGHEISFPSHKLSPASAKRCELLANLIHRLVPNEYVVIFMGKGRLQGDCADTISECMYLHFQKEYQPISNYILDYRSVDTVGDAVISKSLTRLFPNAEEITIITSDWHKQRTCYIFRRVFRDFSKMLSFMTTEEMMTLQSFDLERILLSERKSLSVFKATFHDYATFDDWESVLIARHRLYAL
jgi:hypothetical protein